MEYPSGWTFEATPASSLIDEPVSLRLTGLAPGQEVTLRARTRDGSLRTWSAAATFGADEQGRVDVSAQQPLAGSYAGVDLLGLFWSMLPEKPPPQAFFTKRKPGALTVTVTVERDGPPLAEHTLERRFLAPGVTKRALEEQELVGALFLPASASAQPGVLILNGSDGGMSEHAAALLASRGYAALALAYFGVEGVPGQLHQIPLEYFARAIHWLQAQAEVQAEHIAVIGLSRGGELALLLGATFPEVRAVVAGAPSGLRHSAIVNNRPSASEPAWTYGGEPLPFLGYKQALGDGLKFMVGWITHTPFRNRKIFERLLKDRKKVEQATIPVEQIKGPLLLISGADDQLWPSATYSELVVQRLKAAGHPYPVEHVQYAGAGHFVCFPYGLPSLPPMTLLSPIGGLLIGFGGTPTANAWAARDSWEKILAFLQASLRDPLVP